MLRIQLSWMAGVVLLLAVGCTASDAPPKASSSPITATTSPAAPNSVTSDPKPRASRTDPVNTFLQENVIARDILAERSLVDFLAETLSAKKDNELSRSDFGYAVYQDSGFVYEFLDEKLFGVRHVEPLSRQDADNKIAPYLKALGDPTNRDVPQDLREAKVTNYLSWDLPTHKLRINFAYLPTRNADADLELFGQGRLLESGRSRSIASGLMN